MDPSTVLTFIVFCAATYYCAVQFGLFLGLFRLNFSVQRATPFVSVIVAARNEQNTIGNLLGSLINQSYPEYEIIVVDDRSTDGTSKVVRDFQKRDRRVKLVSIETVSVDMPGKKNALTAGILASTGDLLCFTDADCLPSGDWIQSLIRYFDDKTGVVAGYSPYDVSLLPSAAQRGLWRSVFLRFIEGEEFKGATWSAGAIGINLAWLCTGRNLAYRRQVFDEVGGFERIKKSVSGDDDLFLQLVRRSTDWKIRYCTTPGSFVRTAPPPTFDAFINQRTRHFSSGKFFTFPMKAFFFLFHLSNLILLVGLVTIALMPQYALAVVGCFLAKMLCDLLVFLTGERTLQTKAFSRGYRFSNFVLTELLYILYNALIGPLGFIRTFRWKEGATGTMAQDPLPNGKS